MTRRAFEVLTALAICCWLQPAFAADDGFDDPSVVLEPGETDSGASAPQPSRDVPVQGRYSSNDDRYSVMNGQGVNAARTRYAGRALEDPIPYYQRSPMCSSTPDDCYGNACGCDACGFPNDCGGCCPPPCHECFYFRGEYLLWWVKGDSSPPLVTTSPPSTTQSHAGVLGQPTTTILFGDEAFNAAGRSGGRVVLGWWLDCMDSIEGEFFGLGESQNTFHQTSNGSTILARPFFNLTTSAQDAFLVAYPNVRRGSIDAEVDSTFLGAGVQATRTLMCCGNGCSGNRRTDSFLYGFRYLHLGESLSINDALTSIDPSGPVPVGTQFTAADDFSTSNNFYGLNVGLMTERRYCQWDFTAIARVGLGGTAEHVDIRGNSSRTTPQGQTTHFNGGLLAMPTNIGSYNQGAFTVVPELELKLGYCLSHNWRATIGYDFLYWSSVARPGNQIDTSVNLTQSSGQPLVGTPGPLFRFNESSLWVQGISLGAECRF